jgi:uncharacterized damage-inducible protein DinB
LEGGLNLPQVEYQFTTGGTASLPAALRMASMVRMDPLKIHDYLVLAREHVFGWVRPLSAEEYSRQFPMGLGSLARILTHVMICEYAYVLRIEECPVPPYEQFPFQDETPPPFAALEAAWKEQASRTRLVLCEVRDWNKIIEYPTMFSDPPQIITASLADQFAQLAFHEVHHRAQAMNILRQLGVQLEDIDYNALMTRRRKA